MIVCVQYWHTPRPVYGRDYKSRMRFSSNTIRLINPITKNGIYEPIAVWKIKEKRK